MLEFTTDDGKGTAPEVRQTLDGLAREGARRIIAAALNMEVDAYLERLQHMRDEQGHAMVVRNSYAQERPVNMGAGVIKIKSPRVNDRREGH